MQHQEIKCKKSWNEPGKNIVRSFDKEETYEIIERMLLAGDLENLKPQERVKFYNETCKSLGLNPLTKPFEYIKLNNKLTLYANKGAAEQLRSVYQISINRMETTIEGGLLKVTAYAEDKNGRQDIGSGAVWIGTDSGTIKGELLANAHMRAETKAKRRVTLSICGLGMLDESEVEDIKRQEIYQDAPEIDASLVNTTLAKFSNLINESEDMEKLKECFAEGYRELGKLKQREGGIEAISSLNQAYLNKKQLFITENSDEAII